MSKLSDVQFECIEIDWLDGSTSEFRRCKYEMQATPTALILTVAEAEGATILNLHSFVRIRLTPAVVQEAGGFPRAV